MAALRKRPLTSTFAIGIGRFSFQAARFFQSVGSRASTATWRNAAAAEHGPETEGDAGINDLQPPWPMAITALSTALKYS